MIKKIFSVIVTVSIIHVGIAWATSAWDGSAYTEGDQVSYQGNLYECRPWPYTAWCEQREPGTNGWEEAWDLVGPVELESEGPVEDTEELEPTEVEEEQNTEELTDQETTETETEQEASTEQEAPEQEVANDTDQTPESDSQNTWNKNTSYTEGDTVEYNGSTYECRPWPYTAWCEQREPGTNGWEEAWAPEGSIESDQETEVVEESEPEPTEVEEEQNTKEPTDQEIEESELVEQADQEEIVESVAQAALPGTPSLDWLAPVIEPTTIRVGWNMWWGENGSVWNLYENGTKIHTADLSPDTPNAQRDTYTKTFSDQDRGRNFEYYVTLCNADLCASSGKTTVAIEDEPVPEPAEQIIAEEPTLEEEFFDEEEITEEESVEEEIAEQETPEGQEEATEEEAELPVEEVELVELEETTSSNRTIQDIINSAQVRPGDPVVDMDNPANNPANVQLVMSIIDEATWEFIFPVAAEVYQYEELLKAVYKFPAFCGERPLDSPLTLKEVCAKELATVFAHATQETGGHSPESVFGVEEWRQGLYYITELGCSDTGVGCEYRGGTCQENTWQGQTWPCYPGAKYYGRGAKQLSYNYNYGSFSDTMFGDVDVLLTNPERVAQEGWLAISSAFWFYMTPQSPKPSMHEVVTGFWVPNSYDLQAGISQGFGATINIINGGIECGGSQEIAQARNRIAYYKEFTNYLGVEIDPDEELGCAGQQQFSANGAGAIATYYEQTWDGSQQCKTVTYQTPFSIFKQGDYDRCVEYHFGATSEATSLEDDSALEQTQSDPSPETENEDSGVIDSIIDFFFGEEPPVEETVYEVEEKPAQAPLDSEAVVVRPSVPTIAWLPGSTEETSYQVGWNMYYGDNGDMWRLYENDMLIHTDSLVVNSPEKQSAQYERVNQELGSYTYYVELCNAEGCATSEPRTIEVVENKAILDSVSDFFSGLFGDEVEEEVPDEESTTETSYPRRIYFDDKQVVGYYPEWGTYARDYQPADIPWDQLTTVLYAFINIGEDYRVQVWDTYAALDKFFPGDCWDVGCERGLFNQFAKLTREHPDVALQFSVGGWTGSAKFPELQDANKREIFVSSVREFLIEYPFFDGVDIDWEFPGVPGGPGTVHSDADTKNLHAVDARTSGNARWSLGRHWSRIFAHFGRKVDRHPGPRQGQL